MMEKIRGTKDLRWVLALSALLLLLIGIFAITFRHVRMGFTDTDGYAITESDMADYLKKGNNEDLTAVPLTYIRQGDALYRQGNGYFAGEDMTKLQSAYPLFLNNGLALYFYNDSAKLVTSDFDRLSTYYGMFLADGTSFNADRTQADVEQIYLAELQNGLYANALPMRVYCDDYDVTIHNGSVAHFGEDVLRFYSASGSEMLYTNIEDVSEAKVVIGGNEYTYQEFYELLHPSDKKGSSGDGSAADTEEKVPEENAAEEEDTQEQERQNGSQTGDRVLKEDGTVTTVVSEPQASEKNDQTANSAKNNAQNSKDGSDSSKGKDNKDSSDGKADNSSSTGDAGNANAGNSAGGTNGSSGGKKPYVYKKPTVTAEVLDVGVYTCKFKINIDDPGSNLSKAIATITYKDPDTGATRTIRKAFVWKGESTYEFTTIRSGVDFDLDIEMRYYPESDPGHQQTAVGENVFHYDGKTKTIKEGIDPVILTFTEDDGADRYDRIYPHQIEVREMKATQLGKVTDVIPHCKTLSYVRTFQVELEQGNARDASSWNKIDNKFTLSTAQVQNLYDNSVTWKSDELYSLDPDSFYRYAFHMYDRHGDELPILYVCADGEKADVEYEDENGNRTSYVKTRTGVGETCSEDPTGVLTVRRSNEDGETYNTGLASVSIDNAGKSEMAALYLTVQDGNGSYLTADLADAVKTSQYDVLSKYNLMRTTTKYQDNANTTQIVTIDDNDDQNGKIYVDADKLYDGTGSDSWENVKLPAFASESYTVKLWAVYNNHDRQGDKSVVDENGVVTGYYTKELRTSNYTAGRLTDVLNVNFSYDLETEDKPVGRDYADYFYTVDADMASEATAGLLNSLEYTLTDTADESQMMKLVLTRDGITLNLEDSTAYTPSMDKMRYTYHFTTTSKVEKETTVTQTTSSGEPVGSPTTSRRTSTQTADHEVTGVISIDRDARTVSRSIYYYDDKSGQYVSLGTKTYMIPSDATPESFIAQLNLGLSEEPTGSREKTDKELLETAGLLSASETLPTETSTKKTNGLIIKTDVNVTKSNTFADKDSRMGLWFEGISASNPSNSVAGADDPNKVGDVFADKAMISLDAAQMKIIYASLAQALKDDSSTDVYAAFSKYLFEQVSCQSVHNSANATLHFERRGLKSLSNYRAMAAAYARQNSVTNPQSVTTTNTTLQIRTFRQEPKVHLDEYFASSSKLILYDFYVEDPDSAVRNGYVNVEIYETYDPDDPGANLPVMTRQWETIVSAEGREKQNLTFSGLEDGKIYTILVKAPKYDETPTGSDDTKTDYLIGEGNVHPQSNRKDTGTWYFQTGETLISDLNLDRVQYNMNVEVQENQLIDPDSEGGLQSAYIGFYSNGVPTASSGSALTDYIDIRSEYTENGVTTLKVNPDDKFLAKNLTDGNVFFYADDEAKTYLGVASFRSIGAAANNTASTANDRWYMVTIPYDVMHRRDSNGNLYNLGYVRAYTPANWSTEFYFGRMPDSYTDSFKDLDALLDQQPNEWDRILKWQTDPDKFSTAYKYFYLSDAEEKNGKYWPLTRADGAGSQNHSNNYYWPNQIDLSQKTEATKAAIKKELIPIKEGEIFRINSSNKSGIYNDKGVAFLTEDLQLIRNYDETGTSSSTYYYTVSVQNNSIYVAPEGAAYMLVQADNNDDPAKGDRSIDIRILHDTRYSEWYGKFLSGETSQGFDASKVKRGELLTVDGTKAGSTISGQGVRYETTGYLKVEPGDVYMLAASSNRRVGFYTSLPEDDSAAKVKKVYSYYNNGGNAGKYFVIPEGIHYIRVERDRGWTSGASDRSFLNGVPGTTAYNGDASCHAINFYYCGNLKKVYNASSDLKTSVHVQLATKKDVQQTNLTGKYRLDVYEMPYSSSDNSATGTYRTDETVMEDQFRANGVTYQVEGTFDPLKGCNQYRCIPAKENKTYYIELLVEISAGQYESVSSIYLDVDNFGHRTVQNNNKKIYGVSVSSQFSSINRDPSAAYILNKDLELTASNYARTTGTTFKGILDLQGHTLTSGVDESLFSFIGQSGRSYGQVKNGTIRFRATIGSNAAHRYYLTVYHNYGTIKNMNFLWDVSQPENNANYTNWYNVGLISINYGTIRNFSVGLEQDLISYSRVFNSNGGVSNYAVTGLVNTNCGTIENGVLYGAADGSGQNYSILGGAQVAGLVYNNYTSGVVRNIYGLVDVQTRTGDAEGLDYDDVTTDADGNASTAASKYLNSVTAGTIVGTNNGGTVENVFSTGSVWIYTADQTDSGYDLHQRYTLFTDFGSTVGRTSGGERKNVNIRYAVKAGRDQLSYKNTMNRKVQMATLLTTDYMKAFFGEKEGQQYRFDYDMITAGNGYYPWVFQDTAEKYLMPKTQIDLDAGVSTALTLVSAKEVGRSFDNQGFETVRVTFSMINDSLEPFYVDRILFKESYMKGTSGTDALNAIAQQGFNPDTGLWEVTMDITVSRDDPDVCQYLDSFEVSQIYYRYSQTSQPESTPILYGSGTSKGEFQVDVPFYYPIRSAADWEMWLSHSTGTANSTIYGNCAHPDWNYRILADIDFSQGIVRGTDDNGQFITGPASCYVASKLTGRLEGGKWAMDAVGNWQQLTDENGNVECYTLTGLSDLAVANNPRGKGVQTNRLQNYGAVFSQFAGTMSNLVIKDMTLGVQPDHINEHGNKVTGGTGKTYAQNQGLISVCGSGSASNYASTTIQNVHIEGGRIECPNVGYLYAGAFAGRVLYNYATFTDCTVSGFTIIPTAKLSYLYAGGMVGQTENASTNFASCAVMDLTVTETKGVTTTNGIGGLVGCSSVSSSFTDCYSTGTVTSTATNIGGLVGYLTGNGQTTSMTDSYSAMNLSSTDCNIGGLAGQSRHTLTIKNALFAGSVYSEVTEGGRNHYLLGYRSGGNMTAENSYIYDINENDALVDNVEGVSTVSYENLTGEGGAFYTSDSGLAWENFQALPGYPTESGYLPGVDRDGYPGQLLSYQNRTSRMDDPSIVSIENAVGRQVTVGDNKYYQVEITVRLADGYKLTNLQIDGLTERPKDKVLTFDVPEDLRGTLPSTISGVDASGWKAADGSDVYAYIVVPVDGETGLYKILLNNVGIKSYKENYGLTIQAAPVDDFVAGSYTRVRNFQFEGGVYYEIGNAFDWDLFFGSNEATATTSQLVKVAKVISELKDSDYTVNGSGDDATVTIKNLTVADFKYNAANYANDVNTVYPGTKAAAAAPIELTKAEFNTLQAIGKGTYRPAYASEPIGTANPYFNKRQDKVNIKLTGDLDFAVYEKLGIAPVLNVNVAKVLGAKDGDESTHVMIHDLSVNGSLIRMGNYIAGLFGEVTSTFSGVDFANNSLSWYWSTPGRAGLIGSVLGQLDNCNFYNNFIRCAGNNTGMIGNAGNGLRDIVVVNSHVESSNSSYTGGLAGKAYGDLENVQAISVTADNMDQYPDYAAYVTEEGYVVTGNAYMGGLVGKLCTTVHEAEDPSYEGKEAAEELASWQVSDWEEVDPENHWYDWYYPHYSAQTYYSVVKNVTIDGVTAQGNVIAGGIAGYVANSSGEDFPGSAGQTGDGYALIHDVKVTNSKITTTTSYSYGESPRAGGAFGALRACIAQGIILENNQVQAVASAGQNTFGAGGFVGDLANPANGANGKSCYNEETGEYEDYLYSLIQDVDVKGGSVRATHYVSGVVGWARNSYMSFYHINIDGVDVEARNSYAGGVSGALNNALCSDVTVSNSRFVAGSDNVGSVAGSAGALENIRVENCQVYAAGTQTVSYVGGVAGTVRSQVLDEENVTYDAATNPSIYVNNVDVQGGQYTGGVFGSMSNNSEWKYIHAQNIRVRAVYGKVYANTNEKTDTPFNYTVGVGITEMEARVGGVAGHMQGTIFSNNLVENVEVSYTGGGRCVGGVAGYVNTPVSENQFTNIHVTAELKDEIALANLSVATPRDDYSRYNLYAQFGGIFGYAKTLTDNKISNISIDADGNYVGGVSGYQAETVSGNTVTDVDVYADGNMVGGLFGQNENAIWENTMSHILVNVRGAVVGGISGYQLNHVRDNTISDVTVAVSGSAPYTDDAKKTVTLKDGTTYTFDSGAFMWTAPKKTSAVKLTDLTADDMKDVDVVYYRSRQGDSVGGISGVGGNSSATYRNRVTNLYVSASGNYVGGVNGLRQGGSVYGMSIKDLTVYAGGTEDVGGLIGYAAISDCSSGNVLGNVKITAPHASNVGGLAGRIDYAAYGTTATYSINTLSNGASNNTIQGQIIAGTSAGNSSDTTGSDGSDAADSDSTDSTGSTGGTGGTVTGGDNVGGLFGLVNKYTYIERNSAEVKIQAAGTAVGGLIGRYSTTKQGASIKSNTIISTVSGKDYVSGLIGCVTKGSSFFYNQAFNSISTVIMYNNLSATHVTAADADAVVSFWYAMEDEDYSSELLSSGTATVGSQADQPAYVGKQNIYSSQGKDNPYPCGMKVWDGSWLKTGNGDRTVQATNYELQLSSKSESVSTIRYWAGAQNPDYYENCAGKEYNTNEIYYGKVMDPETGESVFVQIGNLGSGTYNANKANYYTAEKVYDYSNTVPTGKWPGYSRNYPALVSTEDLKTIRFYDNSAETVAGKNISRNSLELSTLSTNSYSYNDIQVLENSDNEANVQISGIQAMDPTDRNKMSYLGFSESLTKTYDKEDGTTGHYVYMPYMFNPIFMLVDKRTESGLTGYMGNEYFYIGTAETVNYGDGLFKYSLTGGIPVPGTHGSILGENSAPEQADEILAGGTRTTFSYVTPRIYMGSAWLLNMDFNTFDNLAGMTMKAYTADSAYVKATTFSSGTEYYTRVGRVTSKTTDGSAAADDADGTGNTGDGTGEGTKPGTTVTLATRYRYVKVDNPTEENLVNYYVKSDAGFDPDKAMTADDYQSRYVPADTEYDSSKTYYQKVTYTTYLPFNATSVKQWIPFKGNTVYEKNADGKYTPLDPQAGDHYSDTTTTYYYRAYYSIFEPVAVGSQKALDKGRYTYYEELNDTNEAERVIYGEMLDVSLDNAVSYGTNLSTISMTYDYQTPIYLVFYQPNGDVAVEFYIDPAQYTSRAVGINNLFYYIGNDGCLYQTLKGGIAGNNSFNKKVDTLALLASTAVVDGKQTDTLKTDDAYTLLSGDETVQNISVNGKYLYILTSDRKMVQVTYALNKNTVNNDMYVTHEGTLTSNNNPVILDLLTDKWPVLNSRLPDTTATQSTDGDSIAAPVEGDSEDVGESADAAEDDGDSTDDSDTAGDSTEAGADESETTGDSTDTAVHNVTPTYYGAAAPKQKTATVAIKPQAAGQTLTLASAQTGDRDSEDRKIQESTASGGSSDSGTNSDNAGDESISDGDTNGSISGDNTGDEGISDDSIEDGSTSDDSTFDGVNGGVIDDEELTGSDNLPSEIKDQSALFEFDYKDYHIRTYLTYSLIEKDGETTVRRMQLFVKNNVLYALNAPDEVVPGDLVIDQYQDQAYMTVLHKDGYLVDLMDPLNYPEGFVNSGIKHMTNNMYSDSPFIMVEYDDGSLIVFNYMTGMTIEQQEATNKETDFLAYLKRFLMEKLNLVKSEMSGAYANALALKAQLDGFDWRDLLADREAVAPVIGKDQDTSGQTPADEREQDDLAVIEGTFDQDLVEGDRPDVEPDDELSAGMPTDEEGVEAPDGNGEEPSEGGLANRGDAAGDGADVSAPDYTGIAAYGPDQIDLEGEEAEASSGEDAAMDPSAAENEAQEDLSATEDPTAEEAEETTDETAAAEQPQGDTASSTDEALDDSVMIVYDSEAGEYSLYSEQDLLKEDDEKLVSLNSQLRDYASQGKDLPINNEKLNSTRINKQDRTGMIILLMTGCGVMMLLIVLGVHRYGERRRREN